jgi:hypothetical protein
MQAQLHAANKLLCERDASSRVNMTTIEIDEEPEELIVHLIKVLAMYFISFDLALFLKLSPQLTISRMQFSLRIWNRTL